MDPASTFAIVVGVEKYDAGAAWNLTGPAADARRFTEWLVEQKVPPENIRVFISPLSTQSFPAAVSIAPATMNNIAEALRTTLRGRNEELFFFFWGGHGIIDENSARRLFCCDATAEDKKNLDLNDLRLTLRSPYFRGSALKHQILIVDACATFAQQMQWQFDLPSMRLSKGIGVPPRGRKQFVMVGTRPGQAALNLDSEQSGIFSKELLSRLRSEANWPPDFKNICDDLICRFETLRDQKLVDQVPGYIWFKDPDDLETEVGQPTDSPKNSRQRALDVSNGLLPYLVDRTKQFRQLRHIITSYRQQPAKNPLICFVHGEVAECIFEYEACLEEEYLWRLLGLPRGTVVYFKTIGLPISGRTDADPESSRREFLSELGRIIYNEIRMFETDTDYPDTLEALEQRISSEIKSFPETLAIRLHLSSGDVSADQTAIQWFLEFWLRVSVNPSPNILCLVFVFIEHAHPASNFETALLDLAPERVLSQLASVEEGDVANWINDYRSRIQPYWKSPVTLRAVLADEFAKSENKLPMSKFVRRVNDLFNISYVPTPS
jgi:hypothetical protein